MNRAEQMDRWARGYRRTLLEDVVPFWMRNALDPVDGALNNCIDDDGKVLSRDRYLWSQGRALWTFSALYNRIEKRPEWLEVAHGLFGYLRGHGRDEQGRWVYRLDAGGDVLDGAISIYVDGFILNGLSEYYTATDDEAAAHLALETYENVQARIARPGSYQVAPYNIPQGMKVMGVRMTFSFFCYWLGKALARPEISAAARAFGDEILRDFYQPDLDLALELVGLDGKRTDTPEGRVCIPGHVIEAMWFLITIYEDLGDTAAIPLCCELIKRHIEYGWDDLYGGLRLARDISGSAEVAWPKADCKPWWVQCEALVATIYAYRHTGDDSFLDWHERIRDYALTHYPTPAGEWTQWLDRQGNKTSSAALPVKDPFHLPRALIYLAE